MAQDNVYTTLKGDLEIRLLELLPGSGNDDICVVLKPALIEALPEYEAISYCWGDATNQRSVLCNGTRVDITASLFTALRHFRHADRPRILWADAICIHQSDLVEKESQVMHMPQVYSQAKRVLIWLGDDDAEVAGLDVSLAEAMAFLPATPLDAQGMYETVSHVHSEAQALQKQGRPNFLDHDWSSLVRLMARPWFRRKWVIQEVCLAQTALVACGGIEFPWEHLAEVAYNTMASGILQLILGNTSFARHVALDDGQVSALTAMAFQNIQIMRMIKTFRDVGSVLDCVMATALFECTDARDHIYAVLSLPANRSPIRPDYHLRPEEIYTNFAVSTLVQEQNLKILGLAPQLALPPRPARPARPSPGTKPSLSHFSPAEPLDLPSWVPNLTGSGLVNPFCCYSVLPQLFHAGGGHTPTVRVSDDKKQLYCQARIIDKVRGVVLREEKLRLPTPEEIEPYLPRFGNNGTLAQTQLWLRNWLRLCRKFILEDSSSSSSSEVEMTPEQWLAFARVMTCGQNNRRDALPPGALEAFREYFSHILHNFEPNNPNKATSHAARELLMAQYGVMLESSILPLSMGRLLCMTEDRRPAQVPLSTQIGDVFAVLLGAETPFVLRPVGQPGEDTYQLIGDCYVDGIMQGESLGDVRYETKEIILQ